MPGVPLGLRQVDEGGVMTFQRGPNLDRPGDHEIRLVLTPQDVPF